MKLQKTNQTYHKPLPNCTGTTLIFAGGESPQLLEIMKSCGARSVLLSWYYFYKKNYPIEKLIELIKDFEFVFMDSGGFTLQQMGYDTDFDMEAYTKTYYDGAERLKGYVTCFGAMDAETHLFSFKRLAHYWHEGRERGIHVIPTLLLNNNKPFREFKDVGFMDATYIAMSSPKNLDYHWGKYYAKLRNNVFHGYAMTDNTELRLFPFRSVDSLTWLGGQKYGTTYIHENGRIKTFALHKKRQIRKYHWKKAEQYGLDFALIEKEEELFRKYGTIPKEIYTEINKFNLHQWVEYAEYLRNLNRGFYWNKHPKPEIIEVPDNE